MSFGLRPVPIMDNPWNVDRTVLRIITVAGTARSTTGAAKGLSLNYGWSPKDFYVAVCTTHSLLLHMLISVMCMNIHIQTMQCIFFLWWIRFCVHFPCFRATDLKFSNFAFCLSMWLAENLAASARDQYMKLARSTSVLEYPIACVRTT